MINTTLYAYLKVNDTKEGGLFCDACIYNLINYS